MCHNCVTHGGTVAPIKYHILAELKAQSSMTRVQRNLYLENALEKLS